MWRIFLRPIGVTDERGELDEPDHRVWRMCLRRNRFIFRISYREMRLFEMFRVATLRGPRCRKFDRDVNVHPAATSRLFSLT